MSPLVFALAILASREICLVSISLFLNIYHCPPPFFFTSLTAFVTIMAIMIPDLKSRIDMKNFNSKAGKILLQVTWWSGKSNFHNLPIVMKTPVSLLLFFDGIILLFCRIQKCVCGGGDPPNGQLNYFPRTLSSELYVIFVAYLFFFFLFYIC